MSVNQMEDLALVNRFAQMSMDHSIAAVRLATYCQGLHAWVSQSSKNLNTV